MTSRDVDSLRPHPVADLLPMMSDDEYDQFLEDVRKNGVREPLWVSGDLVLDGRHRLRAAQQLGLSEVPAREYEGDVAGLVLSLNIHRRHMTASQRGLIVARIEALPVGNPSLKKANDSTIPPSGGVNKPQSCLELSKSAGIGHSTLERGRKTVRKGAPEVVAAVAGGSLSLKAAEKIVDMPTEQQPAAVKEATDPERRRERAKGMAHRRSREDKLRTFAELVVSGGSTAKYGCKEFPNLLSRFVVSAVGQRCGISARADALARRSLDLVLGKVEAETRIALQRWQQMLARLERPEIQREIDAACETLGVSSSASMSAIKAAYRELAMSAHPDRGGSKEAMCAINSAYKTLARWRNR